ncbi:hypothetical protein [Mesorhizobium sp. 1M-11]|uniref:hypothetical protein n=1 Tax=Mesorhizobium sp. 1M-11 TaxID=1529006 RepID=UPI0006C75424|nr:hypothetical protein [Mesorhizobium sp. 1M-11]
MKIACGIALAALVIGQSAGELAAEPLNTMDDVGSALQNCWNPPSGAAKGSVTLQFSFKRDGSLIGLPKATSIRVDGDADQRKQFVQAATDAVQKCVPLALAPKLADGMAGTVFTLQLASPKQK